MQLHFSNEIGHFTSWSWKGTILYKDGTKVLCLLFLDCEVDKFLPYGPIVTYSLFGQAIQLLACLASCQIQRWLRSNRDE